MYPAIVTGVLCFAGGIYLGSKYEQRAVAKALAGFAKLDSQARSMVDRARSFVSKGVRDELVKLGL
jgi:hypothetical protein